MVEDHKLLRYRSEVSKRLTSRLAQIDFLEPLTPLFPTTITTTEPPHHLHNPNINPTPTPLTESQEPNCRSYQYQSASRLPTQTSGTMAFYARD